MGGTFAQASSILPISTQDVPRSCELEFQGQGYIFTRMRPQAGKLRDVRLRAPRVLLKDKWLLDLLPQGSLLVGEVFTCPARSGRFVAGEVFAFTTSLVETLRL